MKNSSPGSYIPDSRSRHRSEFTGQLASETCKSQESKETCMSDMLSCVF